MCSHQTDSCTHFAFLFVYSIFQSLAGFKSRNLCGLHSNLLAGARILCCSLAALADFKCSEAYKLNLIAFNKRFFNLSQNGVNNVFCVLLTCSVLFILQNLRFIFQH